MSVEPDISDDDMSENAHNVVRYILFKAGESGYIGKNDIHKNVMSKSGKYIQRVMEKVTLILHKVDFKCRALVHHCKSLFLELWI